MIDCTQFTLTNLRPLAGCVLIEIQKQPSTVNAIVLPDMAMKRIGVGGAIARDGDKLPGQEAIVRKLGEGEFEFSKGARIVVSAYAGKTVFEEGRHFKVVHKDDVLGICI